MKYFTNSLSCSLFIVLVGILYIPIGLSGQSDKTATIIGVIYDGEEVGKPLIGGNVILNNGDGTATDFNGAYRFNTKPGSYTITFKYIGYQTQKKNIQLVEGETKEFNLTLFPESNQLDDVVISASKYEQKLGDVPISMAVIKPALIENKATRDAEAIVEQVPGIQINENQVSIRGGSGWSYGAGSRVLVMVDGMPMLSGDANDIKWSAIPLENISQIEILKGASSVLYGSSALNGVINIRTQYPNEKPVTKVNISNGFYNKGYASRTGTSLISGDSVLDQRGNQTWWDSPRGYIQGNFSHLRKLSENDELVVGGFFMKDQGYRFGENDQRTRLNAGWKHFSKKINGLSYGLNLNNNFNNSTLFFLWAGADSVLHALGGVDTATTTMSTSFSSRIMVDPYISYINENGHEHHLKTRFFRTDNQNNTNQAATSNLYFVEYQFQQQFENKFTITSGVMSSYTEVISELYGNHTSTNFATYFQGDKKWKKINLTAGMRLEYFKIDSVQSEGKLFNKDLNIPFQPVFRIGGTYQPAEYTFLRASYGQGYRFPSIAEKYISTFVGGLNIFPNNTIQPEYGWSAEIGLKQGFKINNFKGYLDLSGFITRYQDMIEFMFGFYNTDGSDLTLLELYQLIGGDLNQLTNYLGARSTNIQNANIPGVELSIVGQGNLTEKLSFTTLAGYTFIHPTPTSADSAYLTTFSNPDMDNPENTILKYRNRHMLKIDFQLDYKKWAIGLSTRYTSLMENIDNVFMQPIVQNTEILPGYGDYRNARMTGDLVLDCRFAYTFNDKYKLSILANNLLNIEYSNRPGNVMPPRTLLWQFSANF